MIYCQSGEVLNNNINILKKFKTYAEQVIWCCQYSLRPHLFYGKLGVKSSLEFCVISMYLVNCGLSLQCQPEFI